MKRRIVLALVFLFLIILVGAASSYIFTASATQETPRTIDKADTDQEAFVTSPNSSTGSCGVERWSVKTGTDADAGLINLQSQTPTTIAALTSLTTPSNLPANNRIQPTETTVYQLQGTLTQYKLETDSDYHLIMSDSAGKTMIVEIPDPACVGSSSLLLPSIQSVRSAFNAHYTPTSSFQTANVPITVTGVGFFDFLHGQAGVAPNGIELHAVLSIQFGSGGGTPTPTPTMTPTPTPTPTPTMTPTPTPTPIPTPTPTPIPGGSNILTNGGFESGSSPWIESSSGGYEIVYNGNPHTGGNSAFLCGYNNCTDTIYQAATIPSSATKITLSYWLYISTNETGSTCYDYFHARLRTSSGTTISTPQTRCNVDVQGWTHYTFDVTSALSSYKGQQVQVYFDGTTDNTLSSNFYVDDVALTVQ